MGDSFGRKSVGDLGAVLMALAEFVFAVNSDRALLLAAVIVGTISPSGKEVGPFLSIEQAILPQTRNDRHRTVIFVGYNFVGSIAGAVGALALGLPCCFRCRRSPAIAF